MKYTAFFVLGLIIFITPFLGITTEWKLLITRVAGAIIMLGVILRHYYVDSLRYENQAFDEDLPEETPVAEQEESKKRNDDAEENLDENLSEDDIEVLEMEDLEEGEEFEEGEIEMEEEFDEEDDEMSNLEDRSV